ncbi:glypican 1b precursor [Silurus asotus]|uniref:Glypican-1 n=1 Tax=Silurus asotus TaxID=30991 RepID=A0AAD5AG38_SILAS|nr:glypican 1b precursor [Silurus asotus]
MEVRVALVLCVLAGAVSAESASGKSRSCSAFRQFYSSKGFSLSGVPQTQISGEHLRVCPQGYTCCTSQIEENLSNLSKKEFEDQVKESGHNLQVSLNSQYKNFDGYFQELLNRSEASLHDSLSSTFGSLFSQNAQVFRDLYSNLRNYYRGSKVNLEEELNEFWARLLERLVRGLNGRYHIGEDYLDCVAKQAETLRPFGETVREFKLKVTRTFVAARSFVQGLVIAGDVVRKVSQVPLSVECVRALMRQTYCPHCREMAWAKPCAPYCRNVMKGCLANQADLDTEWKNLADAMLQVADKLSRPYSVDAAILSLPKRIADAILYMQDNLNTFNSKVFQACGTPPENHNPEEIKNKGKPVVEDVSSTSAASVEKLLSDVSQKIRTMMQYWIQLPNKLCKDREAKSSDENKCWNGMAIDRYLPDVMGDGLANQINNPEVEIDITKPDMIMRQQIMQLKIMTSRMKNAINGNDVDFQDASDDISGSGSGMCNDDQCFHNQQTMVDTTRRPRVYPNPSVKKHDVKDDGRRILPCSALYLISLATVLLRR